MNKFDIRYGASNKSTDKFAFVISNQKTYDCITYQYTLVSQGRVQSLAMYEYEKKYAARYGFYFPTMTSENQEKLYREHFGDNFDNTTSKLPFILWHYEEVKRIHADMVVNPNMYGGFLSDNILRYGIELFYGTEQQLPSDIFYQGRSFLFPNAIAYHNSLNWNLNTPAVREYAVQIIMRRALASNGTIYLDNITANSKYFSDGNKEVDYLYSRTTFKYAERKEMARHLARLHASIIKEAQRRYKEETGQKIQLIINGMYVKPTDHYVTAFQEELFVRVGDLIAGGMIETDFSMPLISLHLQRVQDFKNAGQKLLYALNTKGNPTVVDGYEDDSIRRAILFVNLIAQDNVYICISDNYKATSIPHIIDDLDFGNPKADVPIFRDGVWHRAFENVRIEYRPDADKFSLRKIL